MHIKLSSYGRINKIYLDGFNSGYLLAQREPELAAKLVKSANGHNEYFSGLGSGRQEYDKEKTPLHWKKI